MEDHEENSPTVESGLADIANHLARIAHALEFLAHRANANFMTEAEQMQSDQGTRATLAG